MYLLCHCSILPQKDLTFPLINELLILIAK